MAGTSSFLRQFSSNFEQRSGVGGGYDYEDHHSMMMRGQGIGLGMYDGVYNRKRVMVVVDESSRSKHAMMWALTHVTDKGDLLTLLHILPPTHSSSSSSSSSTANSISTSLGSLCKASRPEVEIEVIVVEGPKFGTVMSQVKKLEVSVLVLGQKKPCSSFMNCLVVGQRSRREEFVEKCINGMECLTIGVRKQSRSVGGYLISTRWHKNFWLLA